MCTLALALSLCLVLGWRFGLQHVLGEWEVELQRDRRTAIDARWKYALSARSGRSGWVNVYMHKNRVGPG